MRIVAVSDLHADWQTLGVPRHDEVASALESAAGWAVENDADVFLFLGDLADPDNGGGTLRAIELAARTAIGLAQRGVDSIWLAGNHCVTEDSTGATVLSPLAPLEGIGWPTSARIFVAERPRLIESCGVAFACLPFAPVSHAYDPAVEAARLFVENEPNGFPVVVLSHLTIPGIQPGEETTEMPRGRDMPYPFEATRGAVARLSGHYHRRQVFDPGDGGPPLHVCGSACRLTFSEEANEPGLLVIDLPAP